MSSYNAKPSAEVIKRARELRAQGYALRTIEKQMREEGHKLTYVTIHRYTKDMYRPPKPKTKAEKRAAKRAWYRRNAEQINARLRDQRANESPEERADRIEYERLMRLVKKGG
jgi:intein-encoded DNA endonuclease-like protein